MSEPEVYVSYVGSEPIPRISASMSPSYDYIPDSRVVTVEVKAVKHSDAAEAAFRRLVGKRVRLVVVEDE